MSVEVKQSDREAAASLSGAEWHARQLRSGDFDDHPFVQAFANSRHQSEEDMKQRCAKVAEGWQSPLRPGSPDRLAGHKEAAKSIAAAIRCMEVE